MLGAMGLGAPNMMRVHGSGLMNRIGTPILREFAALSG